MLETLRAALAAFRDQSAWRQLMRNGMARDFSWTVSAREYVKVYERARAMRGGAGAAPQKDFALDG
jgi:starch synthase